MTFRRVLSIAPGATRFGFCYLDATELLDWGLRRLHDERGGRGVHDAKVAALLTDHYRAEFVILSHIPEASKVRGRQRKFIETVRTNLVGGRADVAMCDNEDVRNCFQVLIKAGKPTKHQIMTRLGILFPELSPLVPRPRKPWHPQDYWTPMFAAVAQAVAVVTKS